MCDFNNLYTSEKGFILRCKKCAFYQIGYGGMMLSLSATDYEHLCDMMAHLSTKELPFEQMQSRHIVIPTPYFGVNLLLCQEEIRDFHWMLCEARNEIVAQSMMALFVKPS